MDSSELRKALAGDGVLKEAFREMVRDTLERLEFLVPSSKKDTGVNGINDYGPIGSAMEWKVLQIWREHFILEERMLKVGCPYPTPVILFKWARHLDKCTVLMMRDVETGTYYQADQLLDNFCYNILQKNSAISEEQAAEFRRIYESFYLLSDEELRAKIKEYGITTAPGTGNPLSDPYPFNLMFKDSVGLSGFLREYVRPETAKSQGFYEILYELKGNKLPFAIAYSGRSFREEISPQNPLLIIHDFTVAEIEHFVDPEDKSHPKFPEVADLELLMFPGEQQMSGQSAIETRLGEAVSKRTVDNPTLGYFIGRIFLFLTRLGIDKDHLRFRQRLGDELAHDAADCWVAEIECSYGWLECVDIADRPAYDLREHPEKNGVAPVAHENCAEPREVPDPNL